jgi:hypothetical protein
MSTSIATRPDGRARTSNQTRLASLIMTTGDPLEAAALGTQALDGAATRHGRPVAIMIAPGDLESLEESLDILSDPQALAEIRESAEDIAAGRTVPIDEIRAEFGSPS